MAMQQSGGVGSLFGPRVIGRLTPELILRSPQFMNCVNQYEIDLRANRVTAIENLGATEVRAGTLDALPGAHKGVGASGAERSARAVGGPPQWGVPRPAA